MGQIVFGHNVRFGGRSGIPTLYDEKYYIKTRMSELNEERCSEVHATRVHWIKSSVSGTHMSRPWW